MCWALRFSHFDKFDEAVTYLHDVRCATLCGVEITPESSAVNQHPFVEDGIPDGQEGKG